MGDLEDLKNKIADAAKSNSDEEPTQSDSDYYRNIGMRAGAELVGSIAGGAIIGWLLDNWFATKPLFLIIFLLLGISTGFYNIYKITQKSGTSVGFSELHHRQKQAKDNADKNDKE